MEFPVLALGVLLAFGVFGSALFSFSQALSQEGWLRWAHIGCVVSVLVMMAALLAVQEGWSFFGLPPILVSIIGGGALLVAAGAAMMFEHGWSRLSPAPLALLGALAAGGAPIAG